MFEVREVIDYRVPAEREEEAEETLADAIAVKDERITLEVPLRDVYETDDPALWRVREGVNYVVRADTPEEAMAIVKAARRIVDPEVSELELVEFYAFSHQPEVMRLSDGTALTEENSNRIEERFWWDLARSGKSVADVMRGIRELNEGL